MYLDLNAKDCNQHSLSLISYYCLGKNVTVDQQLSVQPIGKNEVADEDFLVLGVKGRLRFKKVSIYSSSSVTRVFHCFLFSFVFWGSVTKCQ